MKLITTLSCTLLLLMGTAAWAESPSNVRFQVNVAQRGKIIGNKVSTVNIWQLQNWYPNENCEGADLTKFVEHIQFMQATGGNVSRDLFRDPSNFDVLDDYDFSTILRACHDALKFGAKPHIKLSVPDKFSRDRVEDSFNVDALPPDNYDVYYDYIRALAVALVQEFGLNEVKTWGWGVLVEFENASWFHDKDKSPEGSRAAFFKLYDYSYAALADVLGPDFYIGAHAMACTEGLWDERDFLDHCVKETNAKTGKQGTPIKYFAVSFYDYAPDKPNKISLAQTVKPIRERALSLGLTDLRYGVDEGRILGSSKGRVANDLEWRIVGQTYQAAYDARTFKILVDSDIDYFSAWSYSSRNAYDGYPLLAYRVAERLVNFKNAKLCEIAAEKSLKEGVDCDSVVGFDEKDETIHIMAYNFKFDLNYKDSADVDFEVNAPCWKERDVVIEETVLDDSINFFSQWLKDKEKYNISDDAFNWSPDSGCLDCGFGDQDVRNLYYDKLRPTYVQIANRPINAKETTTRIDSDGILRLNATLPPHAVIFYTIRAK